MNIIVHIDEWAGWQIPVAGKTLAARIIGAVSECFAVRRMAIVVHSKWATGLSGRSPLFTTPSSTDGQSPASTLLWQTGQQDTQMYRVFRQCDFDSAIIIGRAHIYLWTFMLDEFFAGRPNKEYGLKETTWKELVAGEQPQHAEICHYQHDVNTLQYIYSEMAAGAAWEELLAELESNGKQESIPSEHERGPGPAAII